MIGDAETGRDLWELLAQSFQRSTDSVALAFPDAQHQVTYAELARSTELMAQRLMDSGGRLVCIEAGRGVVSTLTLLAALRAGLPFVFLDPRSTDSRRQQLLDLLQPDIIVRQTDAQGGAEVLAREARPVAEAKYAGYFVFTSGSTGRPKAIAGNLLGVQDFITWQRTQFSLGDSDTFAALTSPTFDVHLRDLLTPLLAGARIVHPPAAHALGAVDVMQWLDDQAVTAIHAVPSLARSWMRAARPHAAPSPHLRCTFFAGEPLDADLVLRWRSRHPKTRVLNLYGPSETTLATCWADVTDAADRGPLPVGRPLPNARVVIADTSLRPLPAGARGQVVIIKEGASHGYVGEQQQGFLSLEGSRAFATGDEGFIANGQLHLTGRLDDQVKIDGVRVEPTGVAAVIRGLPDVADAAVLHVTPPSSLIGFVVLDRNGAAPDGLDRIRAELQARLPRAEVPSRLIAVEAGLPLTASGKVDRQALLAEHAQTSQSASNDDDAPVGAEADDLQAAIAEESAVVLERRVGPDADFVALGGSSLLAAELAVRLTRRLDLLVTGDQVLKHRTPARLADVLRAVPQGIARWPSSPVPQDARRPLSPAQRRYWDVFGAQQVPPSSSVMRLRINLPTVDPEQVRHAMLQLADRHDALRLRLRADGAGSLVQWAEAAPFLDIRTLRAGRGETPADAERRAEQELDRPLQAVDAPPHRFIVVKAADACVLLGRVHHLVLDGRSREILEAELLAHLDGAEQGSALEPATSYLDYAHWANIQETAAEQLGDYLELLTGASLPMSLPAKAATATFRGARLRASPPHELAVAVSSAARRYGTTPFVLRVAAFAAACSQMYQRSDVVIGTPFAGRGRPELANAVGMFLTLLPLRVNASPERDVSSFVRDVEAVIQTGAGADHVHLDRLEAALGLPRLPGRLPLTGAFVSRADHRGPRPAAGPGLVRRVHETGTVVFEVMAYFHDYSDGQFELDLQYRDDVVGHEQADAALATTLQALRGLSRRRPQQTIRELLDE